MKKQSLQNESTKFFPEARHYFLMHIQAAISSLGEIYKTPFANFLTILVIGIALALPSTLILILKNLDGLANQFNHGTQISLYLKKNISSFATQALMQKLHFNSEISEMHYISPEEAVKDFEQSSGLNHLLKTLGENPLPGVIQISLNKAIHEQPGEIQTLISSFESYPEVETVSLDLVWINKLHLVFQLGKRFTLALGTLLAFGVILIIANTLKLLTQNQVQEIRIFKLVGGTDDFIRRPFLYLGFFYGIFGSILSLMLVFCFILYLEPPIHELIGLYNSEFRLSGLDVEFILSELCLGGVLGFLASYVVATRFIRNAELQ